MLSDVIDHGTARRSRDAVKGPATAGKPALHATAGSGYTPNLVCAVWISFDDNGWGTDGAEAALPAWTDFEGGGGIET